VFRRSCFRPLLFHPFCVSSFLCFVFRCHRAFCASFSVFLRGRFCLLRHAVAHRRPRLKPKKTEGQSFSNTTVAQVDLPCPVRCCIAAHTTYDRKNKVDRPSNHSALHSNASMLSTTIFYQKNIRWASSPTMPCLVFRRSCFCPFCVSSVLRFIHFVYRLLLPSCTSRWIFLPSFQVDFVFFVVRSRHCHRRRDDSDPIAGVLGELWSSEHLFAITSTKRFAVARRAPTVQSKRRRRSVLDFTSYKRDKASLSRKILFFSPRIINLASAVVVCLVFKFCPRGQNCPFCP
jgi:hypothetical protein